MKKVLGPNRIEPWWKSTDIFMIASEVTCNRNIVIHNIFEPKMAGAFVNCEASLSHSSLPSRGQGMALGHGASRTFSRSLPGQDNGTVSRKSNELCIKLSNKGSFLRASQGPRRATILHT